ncbi:hypothetical protein M569_01992, partial [Genlisea aurea]
MPNQNYRICFCCRRQYKVAAAEAPPSLKAIFDAYSENGLMDVHNLHRFLLEVQKQKSATLEDAQTLMDALREPKPTALFHKRGINLQGIFKYLFGDINPPMDPKLGVHHDMNAPLSHYFIYTGHNSYLTGNQLSSDCSDAPIVRALLRGVRVIELDIWPNSTKDDIDVLHGRTLTTPVQFLKCLKSIKENAFKSSDYPVIITLEDHLSQSLQAKAAEMINKTFGDMLFTPGPEGLSELPSPESLKKRVIISTKPPKEYLKAKDLKGHESSWKKGSSDPSMEGPWGKEVKSIHAKIDDDMDVEEEEEEEEEEDDPKSHPPQYRCLIAIHAGKGKGGMKEWLRVDPNKVRRLSLSEQELERAAVMHGKDIVRFTERNLLRIYPKGTRFDSSNYNPLIGWMHGAQMVAFNMQGSGRHLWLMHGMFRGNGGCGYVKKPEFLLKPPHDPAAKKPITKTTLKVSIYMGEGWYSDFKHTHFDKYSPPDFYTRVGIAGVGGDVAMKKTKTIEDNWIPTWDEEFEFQLSVPELALLRIEVHEYDMSGKDDFGGQNCLPVSELREGIRAVPLYSHKGDKYKSVKLLMRFDF